MSAARLERQRLRRARRHWASMDGAPDPPPSPWADAALAELRGATAAYAEGQRRREAVAAVRRAVAERKRRLTTKRERPRDADGNREGKGATDVTEDTRAERAREEDPQRPHPAVRGYLDALAAHGLALTEEARERLAVRTAEGRLAQARRVRASAADALDRAKRELDAYAGDGPDSASALAAHARAEALLAVHRAAAGQAPEEDGGAADGDPGPDAPPKDAARSEAAKRAWITRRERAQADGEPASRADGPPDEREDGVPAAADGGTQPDGGAGSPGGSPP